MRLTSRRRNRRTGIALYDGRAENGTRVRVDGRPCDIAGYLGDLDPSQFGVYVVQFEDGSQAEVHERRMRKEATR